VAGIVPDGGTQIAPALAEAYRKILPFTAIYKHIVLLTDGISEEGDSMNLSREAAQSKVTISTVGLGQDVNRAYLERVAALANGKSHFLNDPAGLEQILLKGCDGAQWVDCSGEAGGAGHREAGRDSDGRRDGKRRPRSAASCDSSLSRRPRPSCRSTRKIRCWFAGSTNWGGRRLHL